MRFRYGGKQTLDLVNPFKDHFFFFFFKHIKIDGDIFSWSKMAYFGIFRLDSVFLFVFWVGCPVNTGLWR